MSIDGVTDLWDKLFGAQPDPPGLLVLLTALAGLLAVAFRPVWRVARNAVTIAHEGGHAFFALITGRRLRGIRLEFDTSGLTLSSGKPTGIGMMLTLLGGYIAPSLVGVLGAWLLGGNRITLLLWLAVLLLLVMLINIRNLFGVLSILVTGAVVVIISLYASPHVQSVFAYAGVWFLLFGGVRPVFELQSLRNRGRLPGSDADQLAGVTHVPAIFWVGVFLVVNLAALVVGGFLLAGQWLPSTS
ncbi:M50 family metallopeptidase [Actinoplanes sp. TBRC 11911]|uniref:M50 family metallopeptidase n=1 Tax=Actinoplanes sp. TBRC 11911 TaxID=2729386 RepID=UPI00145EB381|nr:M50 family metallopeptidase [Actinoplanes sp. TBRC 11911]NMO50377.1 M50 family metallopeptidase [Actinoplanes sp. TBRC 11911]